MVIASRTAAAGAELGIDEPTCPPVTEAFPQPACLAFRQQSAGRTRPASPWADVVYLTAGFVSPIVAAAGGLILAPTILRLLCLLPERLHTDTFRY